MERAYDATLDLEAGERTLVCTMTTDAIDRYGEVILPKGVDLTQYRKNPVVLWSHDQGEPPIGRCLWVKSDEGKRGLIAKVEFAKTEDGEEIWQLYKGGFLKTFSIGARPKRGAPPTPEEIRKRPELAECKWIWHQVELTELSCVAVPANPEAMVTAISRGLTLSDRARKRLGIAGRSAPEPEPTPSPEPAPTPTPPPPVLPPLVGRTFGAAHAELVREIRSGSADLAARVLRDGLDQVLGRV